MGKGLVRRSELVTEIKMMEGEKIEDPPGAKDRVVVRQGFSLRLVKKKASSCCFGCNDKSGAVSPQGWWVWKAAVGLCAGSVAAWLRCFTEFAPYLHFRQLVSFWQFTQFDFKFSTSLLTPSFSHRSGIVQDHHWSHSDFILQCTSVQSKIKNISPVITNSVYPNKRSRVA